MKSKVKYLINKILTYIVQLIFVFLTNQYKTNQLMTATANLARTLTEKQIPFRYSEAYRPLVGGSAVIVINPTVWPWGKLSPYEVGVMNGSVNRTYGLGNEVSLIFNPHTFKDDAYCCASGGPGTFLTPVECLQFTGLEIELDFWSWKNGLPQANNALQYHEYVPLYQFYQSREQALVEPRELTKSEFIALQKATYPGGEYNLQVNPESFEAGWVFDQQQPLYWQQVICAFAMPELVTYTEKSLVVPVCYEITYKNKQNKRFKVNQYFVQDMHVCDANGDPLPSLLWNEPATIYQASPYFLHAEVKVKRLAMTGNPTL